MNKHHTLNYENVYTQFLNFVEMCFNNTIDKEVIEEGIKQFVDIEYFIRTKKSDS